MTEEISRRQFLQASAAGVALSASPNPFRFDGLGRATDASGVVSDVTVSVGAGSITVVGETGFVAAP